MNASIAPFAVKIAAAAQTTIDAAGIAPGQISRVVLVGGSSLLGEVSAQMAALLPHAELAYGNAFTAIVDGLAIAAARD